jgi:probable rRNA maturation factor
MHTVEIQNESGSRVDEKRLRAAAEKVLVQHNAPPDSTLTVVIGSNDLVAGLNRQYRGIDSPTDVLSFPADTPQVGDDPPYLGDIIIAYPYAAAQAAREGHDLDDSLGLLVVHGTLHLLGYDHDTPENRAVMWTAQEAALRDLNIPLTIVPALESYDH